MKETALQLTKHIKRLNRLSVAQPCTGCNLMHSYFSAQYKVLKQRVDAMENLGKTNMEPNFLPNVNSLHQSVAMLGMYLHV